MRRRQWGALAAALTGIAALVLLGRAPRWVEDRIRHELALAARSLGLEPAIGAVVLDWRQGCVRISPLAVFGARGAGEPALLEVRQLEVRPRWTALWRGRIEIESVIADGPRTRIRFRTDGTSNLPLRWDGSDPERLFRFAFGRVTVRDGELQVGDRRLPLSLTVDGLRAHLQFDPERRAYTGGLTADGIRGAPIPLRLEAFLAFYPDRAEIPSFRVEAPGSRLEGAAQFRNGPRLEGEFHARLQARIDEARRLAGWDFVQGGHFAAELTGILTDQWRLAGPVRLANTGLRLAGQRMDQLSASAESTWIGSTIQFRDLAIDAPQGRITGSATVTAWRDYELQLEFDRFPGPAAASTSLTGALRARGSAAGLSAFQAQLDLEAGPGPGPALSGHLDLALDVPARRLEIGRSQLRWGNAALELAGELGRRLDFDLRCGDLEDLRAAAAALNVTLPAAPVGLEAGAIGVTGRLEGRWPESVLTGRLRAGPVVWDGQRVASLAAEVSAHAGAVALTGVRVEHPTGAWRGKVRVALRDWRWDASSAIEGEATAAAVQLQAIDPRAGGLAQVRVTFSGTLEAPQVQGRVDVSRPLWGRLQADRLTASFAGTPQRWEAADIRMERGSQAITGRAFWSPPELRLQAETRGWNLSGATPLPFPLRLTGHASAVVRREGKQWQPVQAAAELRSTGRAGLRATLTARTSGQQLLVNGDVRAADSQLEYGGSWHLHSPSPGAAVVRIRRLTLATVYQLLGQEAPPLDGEAEGLAELRGVLLEPSSWWAQIQLPRVELRPQPGSVPAGRGVAELTLRNRTPVSLVAGVAGVVVQRADFIAQDTELACRGNVAVRRKNAWNLLIDGRANLAILNTFRPDILSSGTSTVTVRIRGPLDSPDLNGRMRLLNASLFFRGLANGLDQVNGSLRFDRGRINLEELVGLSGGGTVRLSGYLGFAGHVAYQLQAQLAQVRIRYPEGVSTTTNASLALTGTLRRTLLSGAVTILRASLGPATDLAALLSSATATPPPSPPASELLQGLRYDIRIETAQSAEFATQLTRNVKADADLRLRGSIERPSLLGRVLITQGEVQFFGTRYTINRGEIEFRNPVRIDPQIDLDLETRVRGINVSIRFTGPPNKLNLSYRSDPPLQSAEILALLAVGRTPNLGPPASGPGLNSRDILPAGGNSIVDSAVASGVNSPLQRFFGVTRLKLDPQLIGLDNTPQARVSFEQQLSRDVTITYVQALNRAQQQLVRVQWDLSPVWSAIATRDENGVLSVDFVFKRSLR